MAEVFTQDSAVQTAAQDVAADAPAITTDVATGNIGSLFTDATKDYSQLAPLVPQVIEETKAGYKTTEFWLVLAYEAVTLSGAVHIPGTLGKAIATAAGIVAYVLSRGIAKAGVPYRQIVGVRRK